MNKIQIALSVVILAAIAGHLIVSPALPLPAGVTKEAVQGAAPACQRTALKIKEGETDAAMGGVRQTPYVLTNAGSSACTLAGYPAVELLNKAGTVIKRATKQHSDDPIAPVTLEPGKTAWFSLNYNAGGAGYMGKPCPTYPQVRITTPGAKTPFTLRSDIQSCSRTDLEVTPIRAGSPE